MQCHANVRVTALNLDTVSRHIPTLNLLVRGSPLGRERELPPVGRLEALGGSQESLWPRA
jgi:hypothetical protein